MQGLADGYFIVPYTIGDYLATVRPAPIDSSSAPFSAAERDIARTQLRGSSRFADVRPSTRSIDDSARSSGNTAG